MCGYQKEKHSESGYIKFSTDHLIESPATSALWQLLEKVWHGQHPTELMGQSDKSEGQNLAVATTVNKVNIGIICIVALRHLYSLYWLLNRIGCDCRKMLHIMFGFGFCTKCREKFEFTPGTCHDKIISQWRHMACPHLSICYSFVHTAEKLTLIGSKCTKQSIINPLLSRFHPNSLLRCT